MMQDYSLPATPAHARRLMQLADVARVSISDTIRALAAEGLISDDDLARVPALTPLEQKAAQRLLDYGMRGMLLSDSNRSARMACLSALALSNPTPCIIATEATRQWAQTCEEFRLRVSANPNDQPDCLVIEPDALLCQSVLSERRGGVLILDRQHATHHRTNHDLSILSGPAREVRRTIIIDSYGGLLSTYHGWSREADVRLQSSLDALWPSDALNILRQTSTIVSALKLRNFRKFRPSSLYFMFNVVTDLLGDRQPQ